MSSPRLPWARFLRAPSVRLINACVLFFHAMRRTQNDDWLITRERQTKGPWRCARALPGVKQDELWTIKAAFCVASLSGKELQQVQEFRRHSSTNGYIIFIAACLSLPCFYFLYCHPRRVAWNDIREPNIYISGVRATHKSAYNSVKCHSNFLSHGSASAFCLSEQSTTRLSSSDFEKHYLLHPCALSVDELTMVSLSLICMSEVDEIACNEMCSLTIRDEMR